MSFTKVAPAGIGTEPGSSIRIGDSLLHSTGIDIGTGSGIGVTIRQHGDATFTGIVTAQKFVGDGTSLSGIDASSLKHNNNTKAQATASGVTITGDLGVSGVLTYEDVTNIDSIGVITARDGLRVTGIATATAFHGDGSALTGVSSAEIYGFTGIGSNLQVRTTGGGADNITGDQYAAFEQVFFASTGISFSINTSGNLIATI